MRLLRDTALATAFWIALLSGTAQAKLFQVGPGDDWTNIEAAQAGDVVEIAPGTYSFRVTLEQMGTAAQPIIIRAQDPNNRPVWDLKGKPVGSWPGSYSGGDQGMGAWQVRGEHYVISGIVFQNCQDVSSAAVRAMGEDSLTLRDCLFAHNTTGISGSTDGLLVEFCELHDNGNTLGRGDSGQNISLGGGSLTLRYSYLHDPLQNWNMTLGTRNALVEYCWIARPATYQAIMDSCEWNCGGTGTSPITQRAVFRGNVLIQGDASMNRVFYMHKKYNSGS